MFYFCTVETRQQALSYGVMVTQQSLDLFFLVRVQVAQLSKGADDSAPFLFLW